MEDTLKIGAAALGGYFLGRTKKAKAAISLALWLSGRGRPRDIARNQAVKLLKTDRAQDLLGQVRGPIVSAGKDAALALFESQAGRLSDNLSKRTDQLGESVEGTGRKARRAVSGAGGTAARLADRRRRATRSEDETEDGPEEDYEDLGPSDEADEADEDVDEEAEDEPDDEYEDAGEYEDEYDEAEPEEADEDEEIDDGYPDETDELDEADELDDADEDEPRGRSTRTRSRRSVPA